MTTIKKATTQKNKIVKKNAKFKKATAAEKRIMIAKDVIAALEQKTIRSQNGVWCESEDPLFDRETMISYYDGNDTINNTEISATIKNVKCNVCALGALFVCGVRRFNKITFGDLEGIHGSLYDRSGETASGSFDQDHLDYFLKSYFSKSQLALIEIAFEKGKGGYHANSTKELLAMNMFKGNSKNRMIGIMKNIIKNKGQLVPA